MSLVRQRKGPVCRPRRGDALLQMQAGVAGSAAAHCWIDRTVRAAVETGRWLSVADRREVLTRLAEAWRNEMEEDES